MVVWLYVYDGCIVVFCFGYVVNDFDVDVGYVVECDV